VGTVDHEVVAPGQKLGGVGDGDEVVDEVHRAVGVDGGDAPRHDLDLGHAEGGRVRHDLAVDVGLGDVVHVDQRDRPDPASRQRLGRPRADPADAHHAHVADGDAGHAGGAVEAGYAAEAARGVGKKGDGGFFR